MADCLTPAAGLLIKLGSALIHAEEFLSPTGHPLDKNTFDQLMQDPEVVAWVEEMNDLALLPRKRSATEQRPPAVCGAICATRNEYETARCTLEVNHPGACYAGD